MLFKVKLAPEERERIKKNGDISEQMLVGFLEDAEKERDDAILDRNWLAGEFGGLPCCARAWPCPDSPGFMQCCQEAKKTNINDEVAFRKLREKCYSRYAAAHREIGL